MQDWSPKQIVEELDRYIIGQKDAKRDVAIALRNRYRRSRLDEEMRDEITPKNIIMIGPTGVGKTEIARRLAKLVDAPFVKVEATKFTEVGYVGRDTDSMVRDLVEASIRMVQAEKQKQVQAVAEEAAQRRLVDLLVPIKRREQRANQNPLELLFASQQQQQPAPEMSEEEKHIYTSKRDEVERQLREGLLEDTYLEVEVKEAPRLGMDMSGMGVDMSGLNDMLGGMLPQKTKKRKVPVREARKILVQEESDKLIDMDEVTREALERAEQEGIIFLDEIDKIAGKNMGSGPDVSREGVQRDILPIVEGSTVNTKYGPVKTDFMLFIAAGAFHIAKVSDLIPELQGRFPIRVKLDSLTAEDFKQILTQPENAITKQYAALLSTDNINLIFTDDALDAVAQHAFAENETKENIGARRLHTIVEMLLQDISFNASGQHPMVDVVIDAQYVRDHLGEDAHTKSLNKYIL